MNMVDQFSMQTVDTIKHLIIANRYVQALIILYSAIDTLAWVSLSSDDVTRSVFCQWVDTYMTPESSIRCTSEDLYGAQCALLHSSATESKLSRDGQVSELWYVTSPDSISRLDAYRQKIGVQAKVVYITALIAAFTDGAIKFADELKSDPCRQSVADARMRRWLCFIPSNSIPGESS